VCVLGDMGLAWRLNYHLRTNGRGITVVADAFGSLAAYDGVYLLH
jgi:hypothetical protein